MRVSKLIVLFAIENPVFLRQWLLFQKQVFEAPSYTLGHNYQAENKSLVETGLIRALGEKYFDL